MRNHISKPITVSPSAKPEQPAIFERKSLKIEPSRQNEVSDMSINIADFQNEDGSGKLVPRQRIDTQLLEFATKIAPDPYVKSDLNSVIASKNLVEKPSNFSKIKQGTQLDLNEFLQFVENFSLEGSNSPAPPPKFPKLLEYIAANCQLMLKLDQLIVENHYTDPLNNWTQLDLEELSSLEVLLFLPKSKLNFLSYAYLSHVTPKFLRFDLQNDLRLDLEGLRSVSFQLFSVSQGRTIFEDQIDFNRLIDEIVFQKQCFYNFSFRFREKAFNALLQAKVLFLPRTAEVAHLLLNPQLIALNASNFKAISEKCKDYSLFRKDFYREEYLRSIPLTKDPFFVRAFDAPLPTMCSKNLSYFNHAHLSQLLDNFKTLLLTIAKSPFAFADMTADVVDFFQGKPQFKIQGNFNAVLVSVFNLISPA